MFHKGDKTSDYLKKLKKINYNIDLCNFPCTYLETNIFPSVFAGLQSIFCEKSTLGNEYIILNNLHKKLNACVVGNINNDNITYLLGLFMENTTKYLDKIYKNIFVTKFAYKILISISTNIKNGKNTDNKFYDIFRNFIINTVATPYGIEMITLWKIFGKKIFSTLLECIIDDNNKLFSHETREILSIYIITKSSLIECMFDYIDNSIIEKWLLKKIKKIPIFIIAARFIGLGDMIGTPIFNTIIDDPDFNIYSILHKIPFPVVNIVEKIYKKNTLLSTLNNYSRILRSTYLKIIVTETNRMLDGELSQREKDILLEHRRIIIINYNVKDKLMIEIESSILDTDGLFCYIQICICGSFNRIMSYKKTLSDEQIIEPVFVEPTFIINYVGSGYNIKPYGEGINIYIINLLASQLETILVNNDGVGYDLEYLTHFINNKDIEIIKEIASYVALFLVLSYIHIPSNIKFSPSIYKFATGEKIELADIVPNDVALGINSMLNMTEEEIENIDLDTIIQVQTSSGTKSINIDPANNVWTVNKNNIDRYVSLLIDNKINTGGRYIFRKELRSKFVEYTKMFGLINEYIDINSYDLEAFTYSGDIQLEFDKWKSIIVYNVYDDKKYLIKWFDQYVRSMPIDRQSKLTEFITGNKIFTQHIFTTMYSDKEINIKFVDDYENMKLPTCSVCSLTMNIPVYPSIESMIKYFDVALDNFVGFQMV